MANWNETINIAALHKLYTTGDINLQQVSKTIVGKLKLTEAFASSEPEIIDVMCAFEAIDPLARLKDYEAALDMLYDYGDKDFRLWVEADGVNPQDSSEIPVKTRNPFEEDTKPQFGMANQSFKGPYATQGAQEWLKHHTPSEPKNPEEWNSSKLYKTGDIAFKGVVRYQCVINCSNVDPTSNSYKPNDAWKYLGPPDKNPSDPKLVLHDRLTCSLPVLGKVYPATRKYHYMSEEEFNKKLVAADIVPATMPKELYSYMKDCEEKYQEWLISRWHKQNLTFREPVLSA